MLKFGTAIAVVGTILFIIAIWSLFGYLYFKKGNVKKGFILLAISLLLVVSGVLIGIKGEWNNASKGLTISNEVIQIIDNTSVEDATQEQQATVGQSVYTKINEEDWAKYGDEIEQYYIAWQKSLNDQADEASLKTEFKKLRQSVISK